MSEHVPVRQVLVADDDPLVTRLLAAALRHEGYVVDVVSDGGAAVEHFREHRPRLVILDLCMPQKDGLRALREIREQAGPDEAVVFLLTSVGSEAEVEEAFRLGANDYLMKPFSPRELVARVRALFRSRSPGSHT